MDDFQIKVSTKDQNDNLPIPKIKVIGVGGAGQNAVNHMIGANLSDVEFIAINTDQQALATSKAKIKLQIGAKVTKGYGAGANPELGEKAAEEDKNKISEVIKGADLVFITAGMGGGTGTGAAPVVASIAKQLGCLTIAVVTKPFKFEGVAKMKKAEEGIKKLKQYVDTLIVIPNDRISQLTKTSISLVNAFAMADEILRRSVQGLADLLTKHGYINVDFQDVKTVMKDSGYALIGMGEGSGENRVAEAVSYATSNNLIEKASIDGAKAAIVNIECGTDFQMTEFDEVMKSISEKMDKNATIIPGLIINEEFKDKEKIRVTIIATDFPEVKEEEISKELEGEAFYNKTEKKVVPYEVFENLISIHGYDNDEIPSFLKKKSQEK